MSATSPPQMSATKDSRMGMILVTPTKLAKMELPKMAANLHMAFNRPNAVALRNQRRVG